MEMWMLIALVMMAEFCLHYLPWKMLLRGRELPRVMAYTLGMLGLMVPFTAWLWKRGEMEIIQTLWMAIIAGGLMVFALYGFDHYLELEMRNIEAGEREREQNAKT